MARPNEHYQPPTDTVRRGVLRRPRITGYGSESTRETGVVPETS